MESEKSEQKVAETEIKPSKSKIDEAMEADEPAEQKLEGSKSLAEKYESVESTVLKQEREKLKNLEKRIDKKIEDYKELVTRAEEEGQSLATKEETEEQKSVEAARNLIKGTGLEDRIV